MLQGGERVSAGSVWREEGQGADLSAVSAALTALLLGYLDAALPRPPTDQQHSSTAAAGTAEEDIQVWPSILEALRIHTRLAVAHYSSSHGASVLITQCHHGDALSGQLAPRSGLNGASSCRLLTVCKTVKPR